MDGNAARRHFGAADYLAAARLAPRPGHALVGQAVDASWDEAQTPAMLEQRVAIAEEAVAALLLQDLDSRLTTTEPPRGGVKPFGTLGCASTIIGSLQDHGMAELTPAGVG